MNELIRKYNLNSDEIDKFSIYYEFLKEENEKYNLTSITEKDEVYIKHFYDSLLNMDVASFRCNMKVLDIGSGAGFPSIPLKIKNNNIDLTIIEPIKKRTLFLEELTKKLDIEVDIKNKRAEDDVEREKYDFVLIRAVAKCNVLLELAIPYLKVGGYLVLMKGPSYEEELSNSNNALNCLFSKVEKINKYELPLNMGERYFITVKKEKKTSTLYPRKFAMIKKNPL